jgi:hypothetical protein
LRSSQVCVSLTIDQKVSKSLEVAGCLGIALMSEALRVPATQMLDDGPFEDSWRHMITGEGPNGEQVRIHFGENERVLRTELFRNEEWVRVPKGPKLSRITSYYVVVAGGKVAGGKVILSFGDCPKARELLLENGRDGEWAREGDGEDEKA